MAELQTVSLPSSRVVQLETEISNLVQSDLPDSLRYGVERNAELLRRQIRDLYSGLTLPRLSQSEQAALISYMQAEKRVAREKDLTRVERRFRLRKLLVENENLLKRYAYVKRAADSALIGLQVETEHYQVQWSAYPDSFKPRLLLSLFEFTSGLPEIETESVEIVGTDLEAQEEASFFFCDNEFEKGASHRVAHNHRAISDALRAIRDSVPQPDPEIADQIRRDNMLITLTTDREERRALRKAWREKYKDHFEREQSRGEERRKLLEASQSVEFCRLDWRKFPAEFDARRLGKLEVLVDGVPDTAPTQ